MRWIMWGSLAAFVIAAGAAWRMGGEVSLRASPVEESTAPTARAALPMVSLPASIGSTPVPTRLTSAMLRNAVQRRRLDVFQPGGARFTVEEVQEKTEMDGRWSAIGRVRTALGVQSMVLTVGADAIFGVLPRPDGRQFHVTTSHGVVAIATAGGMAPEGHVAEPDYALPPRASAAAASSGTPVAAAARAQDDASASAPPAEIVVLGLYTDNLVALRGSASAAETEVINLFAIANQAHVDGDTNLAFRVAALRQVTSDPARGNRMVLDDITQNRSDSLGGLDVFSLRDSLAADLVALVRPYNDGNGSCGVAWLGGYAMMPSYANPAYGFSVNNVAPCTPYVVAHELGHNLGSMHDVVTSTSNGTVEYGAYPFSFGYRQDGPPAFATIMAYPAAGQPRVGFFSSPASMRCGAPCGITDEADNARSLRLMASRIAAFRSPPGTISIIDAETFESEPNPFSKQLRLTVRYSGPPTSAAIRFGIEVAGGSALPGVDYEGLTQTSDFAIYAGQTETTVLVDVVGDTLIEPDETVELRLVDVEGATVADGYGVATIRNDDPRVQVEGRLLFPTDMPSPEWSYAVSVRGVDGDGTSQDVWLDPPNYQYRLNVVPRSHLSFDVRNAPAPYVSLPANFADVRRNTTFDLRLQKGVRVSGQLRVPEGDPMPTSSIWLDASSSLNGQRQSLPYVQLSPPDFRYSFWVVPNAWVRMEATAPGPYAPFLAIQTRVTSHWARDVTLSRLPSLVVWAAPMLAEGPVDTHGYSGPVVQLSAPAPAGGVRLRYATVDGTASAGSDYAPASGVLEFLEGERSKHISIEWFGDNRLEGDEHFSLVLSEITGAQPISTQQTFWIDEPDVLMGGPLRPEVAQ